tara:strand:+ start:1029 stop:1484 length:456 start_codon:yes stop_codon:yes gene_type:complete
MKSRLEKVYSKLPNQKVNLKAHKVDLSLVSTIITEADAFEQAESEASYLAYDYGDEIMDAYSDFRVKYNLDDYIINGSTTDLGDITEILSDALNELETKANELGIDPNEIYDNFDDLKQRVDNAPSLLSDAKDKYREVIGITGFPDFWKNA